MFDLILSKFGDYGAESSRRDKFQEHYVAWWCIEMLFDDTISEVICEYGEDLVINRGGVYELYQVKTKQESVDDWKLNDLIPIIAKTFAMVPYFRNVSKCCFVSNKGADGVLYDLKEVINQPPDTWNDQERQIFETFCRNHGQRILKSIKDVDQENTDTVADVRQRLLSLRIETDFHHIDFIQDTNIRRLRQALEQETNGSGVVYTDEDISDIYEALMGIVGKATIGKTREEKTILREHVEECFKKPLQRRTLYRFPTEDDLQQAHGETKLGKKLALGGFTKPFIDNARDLMVSVSAQARFWSFGNAQEILEDVRFRVKYVWADNYDKVCLANPDREKIGRFVLEEMKKDFAKLIEHYQYTGLPFIDELFLTGITWKLSSECKAYWSQNREI